MNLFENLQEWFTGSHASHELTDVLPDEAPVPLIWLFGKTGSGKSSVIQRITGAEQAEIGNGFRPQTRGYRAFAFPDVDSPVVRFLDTRGINEAVTSMEPDASAAADLEGGSLRENWVGYGRGADLLIVTLRVTDHASADLVTQLSEVRQHFPTIPIVVVLTALHDAYPGQPHPDGLVGAGNENLIEFCQRDSNQERVPETLRRSIEAQVSRLDGLYDDMVAVDLTQPEDGFSPVDLGGERLFESILKQVPAAMRRTLTTMDKVKGELQAAHGRHVDTLILSHATVAAGAAAVPLAWVDMPIVLGTQTHMAHRIAKLHGRSLDKQSLARLSVVLGSRAAVRMAIRGFAKAIPFVGSAVNSASAFAMTHAAGKVCHWYFEKVADGYVPNEDEIAEIYRSQIALGHEYWKRNRLDESS